MRRIALAVVLIGAATLAVACSGDSPTSPAPAPEFHGYNPPPPPCNLTRSAELIVQLFPRGVREIALIRLGLTTLAAGPTPPGRYPAVTRQLAMNTVEFILRVYRDGVLVGGTSATTTAKVSELLTNMLCLGGLPAFDVSALGPDGAAVVIMPNSPTTTIATGTGFAGMKVMTGSVTQPTLLTIRRLPDTPGPLLTQLDQYPIFYEFDYNPGTTFTIPVTVALCAASKTLDPTVLARLRLAHNVAPFTMGSIEILQPVEQAIVNCEGADLAAASHGFFPDMARGGARLLRGAFETLVLPTPLEAMRFKGAGGISGSVRNFSPFGGVDPVAFIQPIFNAEQSTPLGQNIAVPPTVLIKTQQLRTMSGIRVNWNVTRGGGSVGNPVSFTDANGVASPGNWRLGFTDWQQTLTSTAVGPAGSSFTNSPFLYITIGTGTIVP